MPRTYPLLRYTLIAMVIVIPILLGSWYFYLRAKGGQVTEGDARRGAGLTVQPSRGIGSTYENIVSSLGSAVSGNVNEQKKAARITEVSKTPAAGIEFVRSGTSTMLRFAERSTGYILENKPGGNALQRLTNTLLPHVFETIFLKNGKVIIRTMDGDTILTTVGTLATSTSGEGTAMLSQKALPAGIRSIVASPSGEEIFYIVETGGGASGIRARWDGTKGKEIFSAGVSGWQPQWLNDGRILLLQSPADGIPGYAYVIGKDGTISTLLRNIPGLTLLPRESSAALLYGESGGGLRLFVRIDEKTSSTELPIRTIADKCVWSPGKELIAYCAVPQVSPGENFLNRWYKGEVHTADAWWRIDARTNAAEQLYAPTAQLDVKNPVIDKNGQYIAFINAIDQSPWILRIAKN